jgi:hypothetical protein
VTDLKRKVMAANKNKAPEKGIKITVGAGVTKLIPASD